VNAGRSHYESIGRIAVKSRGQAVYRDYDVSIKGQNSMVEVTGFDHPATPTSRTVISEI
jgi:hypothetical protein